MSKLKPEIGVLNHVHTDSRRSIEEFNGTNFAVTQFKVTSTDPLGNHFHKEKTETFFILKGGGTFLSGPVNDDGDLTETMETKEIKAGTVVFVPELLAHTFILTEGTELICFSSSPYKEDSNDTFPCKLA